MWWSLFETCVGVSFICDCWSISFVPPSLRRKYTYISAHSIDSSEMQVSPNSPGIQKSANAGRNSGCLETTWRPSLSLGDCLRGSWVIEWGLWLWEWCNTLFSACYSEGGKLFKSLLFCFWLTHSTSCDWDIWDSARTLSGLVLISCPWGENTPTRSLKRGCGIWVGFLKGHVGTRWWGEGSSYHRRRFAFPRECSICEFFQWYICVLQKFEVYLLLKCVTKTSSRETVMLTMFTDMKLQLSFRIFTGFWPICLIYICTICAKRICNECLFQSCFLQPAQQ